MDKELHLKLTVRLYTDDNQRCFGPGIATLLERVREHKSLRSAAASMEMAYSKAWTIMRKCEAELGFPLLVYSTGGRHGGGAAVTEEARKMLAAYDRYCLRVSQLSEALFQEEFQEFL